MDKRTIERRYMLLNEIIGRIVGIWPEQSLLVNIMFRISSLLVLLSSWVVQVAQMFRESDIQNVLDEFIYLSLAIVISMKYAHCFIHMRQITELRDGLLSDWMIPRPKEELAILAKYAGKGKNLGILYTGTMFFASFMFSILPAAPRVLDIVRPLNESRGRALVYPAYYFVDEDKYYYFIIVHEILGCLGISCGHACHDLNLLCYVQHACGLFAVSGYRFRYAVEEERFYDRDNEHPVRCKAYANACYSIAAHFRAIEYTEKLAQVYDATIFCLMGVVIIEFTVTFLKVANVQLSTEYVAFCVFMTGQVVHILFLCLLGQWLETANADTVEKISESFWYNGSSKSQLLYVLVFRKCLTPAKVTAGGLVEMNLNTCVQVVKLSFSFYTVLKPE